MIGSRFAPEIIDGYGFCSRGRVSPLTLAAATGNADAVGALLKLYNTSAWADTIDLCGCLPLIEAAARCVPAVLLLGISSGMPFVCSLFSLQLIYPLRTESMPSISPISRV